MEPDVQILSRKVNKSTNEDETFRKVSAFLENVGIEYRKDRGSPKVETLRQRHARLMCTMFEVLASAIPQKRKEYGAPEPQILAECVIDRPDQREYSNLDSKAMTFTYGSYSSTRRTVLGIGGKDVLQELIAIKKEIDWWNSCNCRLFVNKLGRFFRDDKRLKLWKATYKNREISNAVKTSSNRRKVI